MSEKPVNAANVDPKAIKEMEAIMRVAFVGRQVLNFACSCVARNVDPKALIEWTDAGVAGNGEVDNPVTALWRWINSPTPENLHKLSVITGFNIEKTAEKMRAERESGEETVQ